ncbi:putative glycine dehydrogenase (decarboxylating) subunit 1 [Planctomycetes bacterium LzC2]|uniref:Probable glycine dehydrogenase (decarboxylating) subunit 1 n=2 Tax=Alienimonas chondri TaxID=2681879 RepID=A0ABX1V7E5_9PLAN|nr:putative glycine dehydrogenase (decarboxylating) subunit 1 [Alienimonas chondri]
MLAEVGAESVEDLLAQIPASVRLDRPLNLPEGLCESELQRHVAALAERNRPRDAANFVHGGGDRVCFLGGGVYDHFVPAAVDEIAGRGEFYTAYTPYQAEASQGSLQAFFEFQTLVCRLTGFTVANASLYDGGTAAAEAALLAIRETKREGRVVVLGSVHPEYRQTLSTLLEYLPADVVTVDCPNGVTDVAAVEAALTDDTAALIVQHPNFFGNLEDAERLFAAAKAKGVISVQVFDPVTLGLLKSPAELGADIAVGEGQGLGIPMQYGGPYLGLFACREEFLRKTPGRLIGRTEDADGRECYVLALQTREQHIRRGKATSNICSNQGLLALRATVHLALLGPQGLREVADLSVRKTHYLADRLCETPGVTKAFDAPFVREVCLRVEGGARGLLGTARAAGFDLGPALSRFPAELFPAEMRAEELVLVAATERRTKQEIDLLAAALSDDPAATPLDRGEPVLAVA